MDSFLIHIFSFFQMIVEGGLNDQLSSKILQQYHQCKLAKNFNIVIKH